MLSRLCGPGTDCWAPAVVWSGSTASSEPGNVTFAILAPTSTDQFPPLLSLRAVCVVCMQASGQPQVVILKGWPFHCLREGFSPIGFHPRRLPVPTSPALGLQVHGSVFDFLMCVLGTNTGKNFYHLSGDPTLTLNVASTLYVTLRNGQT